MIDLCPQCSYPLKGLPADHNCPECGLAYDAESEIYKHVAPKQFIVGLFGTAVGSSVMFFQYFLAPMAVGAARVARAFQMLLFLAMATTFVLTGVYVGRIYKAGPLVAVLPEGLFLRLRKPRGQWIYWDNISRAVVNRATRGATLMIKDVRTTFDVLGVFKTPAEAQRFVDQVNGRIASRATATGK